jgi:hypothetical protein
MFAVHDQKIRTESDEITMSLSELTATAGRAGTRAADAVNVRRPRAVHDLLPRSYQAIRRRSGFLRCWLRGPRNDARHEALRSQHAAELPELSEHHSGILAELRDDGVAVRTVELPAAVHDSVQGFINLLGSKRTNAPCAKTTSQELAQDPRLFRWGLSADLLDLAECHVGLSPRYLGVEVKREMLNAATGHSHDAVRRWHVDHEDSRILKLIVYLSDVESGSGPLEYLDLRTSATVLEGLGHGNRSARVEERVRARVSPQEMRQVTGPAMTAIYLDTAQLVHRVFAPTTTERYSVTFAYCSRDPYLTYPQLMLPAGALSALWGDLSTRQRDALCCKSIIGRRTRRQSVW